jgi:hypothetical protein
MNVVSERHEIDIPSADAVATPDQIPDNSHWNKRRFSQRNEWVGVIGVASKFTLGMYILIS